MKGLNRATKKASNYGIWIKNNSSLTNEVNVFANAELFIMYFNTKNKMEINTKMYFQQPGLLKNSESQDGEHGVMG